MMVYSYLAHTIMNKQRPIVVVEMSIEEARHIVEALEFAMCDYGSTNHGQDATWNTLRDSLDSTIDKAGKHD